MEQKSTYMEQYNEFLSTYCRNGIHDPGKTALGLPPGTVIQGRYIAGCLERYSPAHDTITYIGLDMVFNRPVLIQEYFLFDNCARRADGSIVVRSGLSGFYGRGVKAYVEDGNQLMRLYKEGDIITLYSCFEENNTAYLVTEYMIRNVLLEEILEVKGLLPPQEALAILKNLLRALRKCHDQGLFFGNLDAENVYVYPGGIVKLAGLNRAMMPDKSQTDAGDRGTWTDVYNAAMLFVRMIQGKSNIHSREENNWRNAIPKEMQMYVPVIRRAMQRNTERRHGNAGEFLQRLEVKEGGPGWNQERVVKKRKKRLNSRFFLFSSAIILTAALAALATAVLFTGRVTAQLRETPLPEEGSADNVPISSAGADKGSYGADLSAPEGNKDPGGSRSDQSGGQSSPGGGQSEQSGGQGDATGGQGNQSTGRGNATGGRGNQSTGQENHSGGQSGQSGGQSNQSANHGNPGGVKASQSEEQNNLQETVGATGTVTSQQPEQPEENVSETDAPQLQPGEGESGPGDNQGSGSTDTQEPPAGDEPLNGSNQEPKGPGQA